MAETTTPEMTLPLAKLEHTAGEMKLSTKSRGVLTIRGDQEQSGFSDWFKSHFNVDCPKVGETVRGQSLCLYWQGPDQLLLCCEDYDTAQEWLVKLENSRPETPWVSVIDTSDYYCTICLEGKRGFDILRQGSPYDFASLTKGRAILTGFQHANILVDHADENRLEVMVRTSFSRYLWDHLVYASNQLAHF